MDKDQAQPDVEETEMDKSEVYLEEYETQYFGFTPKSFCDGGMHEIINLCDVNNLHYSQILKFRVRYTTFLIVGTCNILYELANNKLNVYCRF